MNFTTGAGLKGTGTAGSGYLYTGGLADWRIVGIGDVNGDGIPDLVFQNGAGQVYAWFLNGSGSPVNFTTGAGLKGTGAAGSGYLYPGGLADWRIVGIADVNGDGKQDLIFQNSAGQVYAWFLSGTGSTVNFTTGAGIKGTGAAGSGYLYSGALGDWRIAGIGDVNGDGVPDLVFQNNAGQIYQWFLNGTGSPVNLATGAGLKRAGAAGSGYLYPGGLSDWRVR